MDGICEVSFSTVVNCADSAHLPPIVRCARRRIVFSGVEEPSEVWSIVRAGSRNSGRTRSPVRSRILEFLGY
uniref:Uncharacterized protein n=1 Tax=Trichogramma kaykai TaxID=54128 RepID=A0ABD2WZ26_9HYME